MVGDENATSLSNPYQMGVLFMVIFLKIKGLQNLKYSRIPRVSSITFQS